MVNCLLQNQSKNQLDTDYRIRILLLASQSDSRFLSYMGEMSSYVLAEIRKITEFTDFVNIF